VLNLLLLTSDALMPNGLLRSNWLLLLLLTFERLFQFEERIG